MLISAKKIMICDYMQLELVQKFGIMLFVIIVSTGIQESLSPFPSLMVRVEQRVRPRPEHLLRLATSRKNLFLFTSFVFHAVITPRSWHPSQGRMSIPLYKSRWYPLTVSPAVNRKGLQLYQLFPNSQSHSFTIYGSLPFITLIDRMSNKVIV